MTIVADDAGLCPEVDEAVRILHDRGIVGRASLLANMPQFDSSVNDLRVRPTLEVAVHLNLTDGPPVLPPAAVPTLVDETGLFKGGRHYGVIAGIVTGRLSRREIHREWRAQIEKVQRAGLTPCELNAHGHLHLLPHLHGIVLDLQREFRIGGVRLVRSREWPRGVLLHACSIALRRGLRRRGLPHVWLDRSVGLRKPGEVDSRIRRGELLAARGPRTDLIVHPAARPNAYHDRWGYRGEEVFNWLLAASDMR